MSPQEGQGQQWSHGRHTRLGPGDLFVSGAVFGFSFPSSPCSSSHPTQNGLLLPLPPAGRAPCSPAPPWQEPFCLVFGSLQE